MRHCLIMTAYKDLESINRLIGRTPRDWGIYIHLDKKSAINPESIDGRAKIFSWKNILWGAWEHIYCIHELLTTAYNDGGDYDYYHICTGQDYFLTNPIRFDEVLGNDGLNYIDIKPYPRDGWWGGGYRIYKYKSLASYVDIRDSFWKHINKRFYEIQKLLFLGKKIPDFPLYSGFVYASFHVDFVAWMINNPNVRKFLFSMQNTTCFEELFYQTIIMNSPFKNKIGDGYKRFARWDVPVGPKFLEETDFPMIKSQKGMLFCRKIETNKCGRLHYMIDEIIS